MIWITISGLVVLFVGLVLAFAFEGILDRASAILATVAGALLSASLLFYSLLYSLRVEDVESELLATLSVLSGICASAAWFFMFVALIRMATRGRLPIPGMHSNYVRDGGRVEPAPVTGPAYGTDRPLSERPLGERGYATESPKY